MDKDTDKKTVEFEETPGYLTTFLAVFSVFAIYISYVFLTTPWGAAGAHH